MQIRYFAVLLGSMLTLDVAQAASQGIALPTTPSTRRELLVVGTLQRTRIDTVHLDARPLRGATNPARIQDTISIRGEAYQIANFSGDTAFATRTFVEEVEAYAYSDERSCPVLREFRAWPVLNRSDAKCFWGQTGTEALKSAMLSGGGDARSVTIDLVSDLIGPVRAYMTASVAAADTDEDGAEEDEGNGAEPSESVVDANTQRFLANGGNAVLGLLFPGPTFRTASSIGEASPDFMGYVLFAPRIGFDVPQANTTSTNAKVNVDVGPEISLTARGEQITLFTQLRMAYVIGSPEFYQGLGRETNRGFGYSQANVGLSLRVLGETNILVSWSKPILGPDQLFDSGSQLHFSVQKVQQDVSAR